MQYKLEGTGHIVGEMTRDLYLRVMRKMMADLNVSPDSIRNKSTEASISAETHSSLPKETFRFYNFRCQFTMPEPKESDYTVVTIVSFPKLGFAVFADAALRRSKLR